MGWGGMPGSDEAKMWSIYPGIEDDTDYGTGEYNVHRQWNNFKAYSLGMQDASGNQISSARAASAFPLRDEETIMGSGSARFMRNELEEANPNWTSDQLTSGIADTTIGQEETAGGTPKFMYSPAGYFLGARTSGMESNAQEGFGPAKSSAEDMAKKYLGYSSSGGWRRDAEKFNTRRDRIKQLSTWQPERVRGWDRDTLARQIGAEFSEGRTGSTRDSYFTMIDPFEDSEFGGEVMQAEDSRALQYGSISSDDMEKILNEADAFNPVTSPEGWDDFKDDIEAGRITDTPAGEQIGSLLEDWFDNIRTGDQRRVTDLQRDIKAVSTDRIEKGSSDRQGMLSEEVDRQSRLYGSGLAGIGESSKSQLRIEDLLATGRQSDIEGRRNLETLNIDLDEAEDSLMTQDASLRADFDTSKYEYGDMSNLFMDDWMEELWDNIYSEMGEGIER